MKSEKEMIKKAANSKKIEAGKKLKKVPDSRIKAEINKKIKKLGIKSKIKKKKSNIKKIISHKIKDKKKIKPKIKKVKASKKIKIISKHKIPTKKSKIERISTGIKGVDEISEGGFGKNSTNLIIGDGGSGKTIFGVQFLADGIKKGEKCLYITFEEKKEDFYENMESLYFDLNKFEKEGKFFFIEYTPEKVKTMLEEGGGAIESLILKEKIKRVVIDSMTSFGLLFKSDLEKRESILSLFNMLKKWDCTTLLTYEGDTGDSRTNPDILELESDSAIILYLIKEKNARKRYLEILMMRGTSHSSKTYEFSIEKDGIVLHKGKK